MGLIVGWVGYDSCTIPGLRVSGFDTIVGRSASDFWARPAICCDSYLGCLAYDCGTSVGYSGSCFDRNRDLQVIDFWRTVAKLENGCGFQRRRNVGSEVSLPVAPASLECWESKCCDCFHSSSG